jgi:TRAP-type C4-dicarboxylate transport system permease small subunit
MSLRAAIIKMDEIYILLLRRLVFALLFVMFVVTLAGTFARYTPGITGLFWAEEVTRYTSIWMVFIASAIGLRRGVHLGVDVFVLLLPQRIRQIVAIIGLVLIFGFEWILVYFGAIMTISNMDQMSSALEMPMGLPFLAIPVGGLLMAYETGRELWACAISEKTG